MGRRGPPPTPTKILKDRGSWRGKKRKHEPKPEAAAPDKPTWLSPVAKAEWDRVAPELIRMQLLTAIDWVQFAAYCQEYAHWVEAERQLKKGMTLEIKDKYGNVKFVCASPWWGIAQKALEKVRQFAREFGLSPASRVGLTLPKPPEDGATDEVARILGLKVTG